MRFNYNPYYYHTFTKFKLRRQTLKAYLIDIGDLSIWIPKSLCKEFNNFSAYIHTDILNQNIKKAKQQKQRKPFTQSKIFENDVTIQFDNKQLKQMITLCHPDKHQNSKVATEITTLLLKNKK